MPGSLNYTFIFGDMPGLPVCQSLFSAEIGLDMQRFMQQRNQKGFSDTSLTVCWSIALAGLDWSSDFRR